MYFMCFVFGSRERERKNKKERERKRGKNESKVYYVYKCEFVFICMFVVCLRLVSPSRTVRTIIILFAIADVD